MKLRNVAVIVTLIFAVMLPASVFAAAVDIDCPECKEGAIVRTVPIPTATADQQVCNPREFDFDNDPLTPNSSGGLGWHEGYCAGSFANEGQINQNVDNYRAIMAICDCITGGVNTNRFSAGRSIGIRMTILVNGKAGANNGVYWQGAGSTTNDEIIMRTFENKNQACAAESYASINQSGPDVGEQKSFGTVAYYTTTNPSVNTNNGRNPNDCTPENDQRLITLQSFPLKTTGYTVTQQDVDNLVSYWGIDIPPMVVMSNAPLGGTVQVKIELLDTDSAGICSSCTPICECIVDIAKLGCDEVTTDCVSFPYVVTQIDDTSGWSTGIALTNLSTDVTTPTITVKLIDSTGAVFTTTQSFAKKTDAFMLDSVLTDWTWSPASMPAPGAAQMQVRGNFKIDGYQFMTDGTFGAGTLGRTWTCDYLDFD